MKNFFTSFFGSCLGVFGALVLGVLVLIGIAMSSATKSETYSSGSILKLKLESFIPEKTDNVANNSNIFNMDQESIGLRQILGLIEHAATDDKIVGIVLENTSVSVGQATIKSLMDGLKKFKTSGKFIYSYADSHSQSSYLLSSVADSMFINPQGGVELKGYGVAIPFLKNMLDKVGVKMEIFYAGNFKSATEPFRLTEMSDYNKLQTRQFLGDLNEMMIAQVAENRKLEPAKVIEIIKNYEGRTAKSALANNLVDGMMYSDEFDAFIRSKLGITEDKKIKTVTLSMYDALVTLSKGSSSEGKIAIINAEGEIGYGSDEPGMISEKKFIPMLTKIRLDDKIKAVVLRVNSPGGNAFSSEMIWRELELIKKAGKPVIASFGDYAASGGYYIAAGADYIVAQPNTLTGSIGVFMMLPNATKLLNDKIGVTFDTIKTAPLAVGFSPFLDLTDRERALLQESTDDIYKLFIERVSTGRKLSIDSTKSIAQGRIWAGKRAIEIGLVDELGDLDAAIAIAAKRANLTEYKISEYPTFKEDMFQTIIKEIAKSRGGEEVSKMIKSKYEITPEQAKLLEKLTQVKSFLRYDKPTARLPFMMDFE